MEENSTYEPLEKMPKKNGNAMIWIAIVVIALIVGAVFFFRTGDNSQPASSATTATIQMDKESTKVFDISGKPFEYSENEIRVKKGDMVVINFTSTLGMHDWVVDEFNARTKVLQAEQSDSVTFIADKTGTFEYYCSVPTHREQGMVGKLIVE